MISAVLFLIGVQGLFLRPSSRDPPALYESWIGDNLAQLGGRGLDQITLPGTHDSAAYNLTERYMQDAVSDLLEELIWVAKHLYIPIETVIEKWATSHDRTVTQQLFEGIRYFDLRAGWDAETKNWYAFHLLIGNDIENILTEIKTFLDSHPHEIVVIEISHFDGEPTDEDITYLQNLILSIFEDMLIPSYYPLSTPIESLVAQNLRVLTAMKMRKEYDVMWHWSIWNNSVLINTYANTPLLTEMIVYNIQQVDHFMKESNSTCLYKISWTLTPNTYTIISSIFPWDPNNLIELADSANPHLIEFWKNIEEQDARMGNLVLFDHYQTSDIMQVVYEMNGIKK
jgi:hypothetical protein